jgi:hypothetical protein
MDRITLGLVPWQILWAFQESNQFRVFFATYKFMPSCITSCCYLFFQQFHHVQNYSCTWKNFAREGVVVCCWLHHHHRLWRRTDILMLCEASMSKKAKSFLSYMIHSSTGLPHSLGKIYEVRWHPLNRVCGTWGTIVVVVVTHVSHIYRGKRE